MLSAGRMAALCAGFYAAVSVSCFVVRIFCPVPFWTPGLSFQPAFIPQYVLCYSAGIWGRQHQLLSRIPTTFGWVCLVVAALWSVAGFAASIFISGFEWGWVLAAWGPLYYTAWWTFFEQSFAVLWGVGLLVAFRQLFNRQGGRAGALVIGAAYTVYILHCLVEVAWARLLQDLAWPPAGKAALLTPLTMLTTWAVAMAIIMIPGVRRVL
jgi:hypothetical protein